VPPLQAIVANGGCRLQRRLHVAGIKEFPFLLRVVGPHAREAIGLQLGHDLQTVGVLPVHALLHLLKAALNALQPGFGPNDVISALNLTVISPNSQLGKESAQQAARRGDRL